MADYIKSAFNYHGNKAKLLPQLLPLFPKDISMFCDVFGGGFTVGINVEAKYVIYNDIIKEMAKTMEYIRKTPSEDIVAGIRKLIERYNLTPDEGSGYLKLREEYNNGFRRPLVFYTLMCYSFNNLVRLKDDGTFNAAHGKGRSHFTDSMEHNLTCMCNKMKRPGYGVLNLPFNEFPIGNLCDKDMVYCDPPYLITDADYNKFWSQTHEYALLRWLDKLNKNGVRFGLSNVIRCKDKINHILLEWGKKYQMHPLEHTYDNASPSRINKESITEEIFICNYK